MYMHVSWPLASIRPFDLVNALEKKKLLRGHSIHSFQSSNGIIIILNKGTYSIINVANHMNRVRLAPCERHLSLSRFSTVHFGFLVSSPCGLPCRSRSFSGGNAIHGTRHCPLHLQRSILERKKNPFFVVSVPVGVGPRHNTWVAVGNLDLAYTLDSVIEPGNPICPRRGRIARSLACHLVSRLQLLF